MGDFEKRLDMEDRRHEKRLKDIYRKEDILNMLSVDRQNKGIQKRLQNYHNKLVDYITKIIFEVCSSKRLVISDDKNMKLFTIREESMYFFDRSIKPNLFEIIGSWDIISQSLSENCSSKDKLNRLSETLDYIDENWPSEMEYKVTRELDDKYISYRPSVVEISKESCRNQQNDISILPGMSEKHKWYCLLENNKELRELMDNYQEINLNLSNDVREVINEVSEMK